MGKRTGRLGTAINHAVEAELKQSVICARCGATLQTFADKCTAVLADICPGFERIEEVRQPIMRRLLKIPTPENPHG